MDYNTTLKDSWKIKLFADISNYLDKKYFNGQLILQSIVISHYSKKNGKVFDGVRGFYEPHAKVIGINSDEALIIQVQVFLHELAHAYQDQVLNSNLYIEKNHHNKKHDAIYETFVNETENFLNIVWKYPNHKVYK